MPADLPSLDRLTADLAVAMHAAERAEARRWWRRGTPLAAVLLALAIPGALGLHAAADGGGDPTIPTGLTAAQGCAAAATVIAAAAAPRAFAVSRTDDSRAGAASLRPCA